MSVIWTEVAASTLSDRHKAMWGWSPDWVCEDFAPDGIRPVSYYEVDEADPDKGDWFVSIRWCGTHDEFMTDTQGQPTHIAAVLPTPDVSR